MNSDEVDLRQPTEWEEGGWREAEEELLAQARELSREITERVRTVVAGEGANPPNKNKGARLAETEFPCVRKSN